MANDQDIYHLANNLTNICQVTVALFAPLHTHDDGSASPVTVRSAPAVLPTTVPAVPGGGGASLHRSPLSGPRPTAGAVTLRRRAVTGAAPVTLS